jgi:membrane-bound lytic murein transglycosylase D
MLAAGALSLAGCEETATKQVKVRPPAATPAPAPDYARLPLPLPEHPVDSAPLARDSRPAIDTLVAKVQASYDAGQQEYKAGAFVKAQSHFDHAVKLILTSGFQADSDPRLSKLFDQIGEAVHSDELSALNSSEEQESETPAEPAPIDEIADLTLPAGDPRLALKAEKELISVHHDLPLTVNDSVLQYLSFFTSTRGRAVVGRGLERAGRYSDMIRRVLKEEGVPQDLIYLAQAESAFQPQAVSRAGARGIWQFMPYRGEEYDLERSYWVDERSDPEKATRAAARHLRDLYAMFGDWYLVMAAYNSGPLNVARAVERTGYADFWQLQKRRALPRQTQNYVPIIIALALVAKDPALYGVQVDPEKPAEVETVKLERPINLPLVADAAGLDADDLRLLNPQLLRNVTPNEPGFELKLPAGAAQNFEENIQQVPEEKWASWRLHTAAEGETLSEIARRYRVTVQALEAANHLEARASVPAGFLLNVPTPPPVARLVHYRVRRGDTLAGIAGRFDVTVAELKRWNHISGSRVSRGVRLRIYAGGQPAEASRARAKSAQNASPALQNVSARSSETSQPLAHRVKRGETLYSIARQYQVTVSAIRLSNGFLADRALQAGDVLTIQR